MKQIKNYYLLALIILTLIAAFLHMFNIFIYIIKTRDVQAINFFNVITLNLLFPSLGKGIPNLIISLVVELIIFLTVLIIIKLYSKSNK